MERQEKSTGKVNFVKKLWMDDRGRGACRFCCFSGMERIYYSQAEYLEKQVSRIREQEG